MDVGAFLAVIRGKLPPAPEGLVADFEASLGCKLPEDYREFLVSCNGGHVGGALWFKGPTPDGQTADAGVHHVGGFRKENYLSMNWRRECYEGRIPNALLWIMDDPFGNAICLGIFGDSRGKVYFWDHENEPEDDWDGSIETAGNIQLLANGFVEFVAGLKGRGNDA